MKILLTLMLSLTLVACSQTPKTDNMPAAPEPGTETEIEQNDDDIVVPPELEVDSNLDLGQGVTLNDFTQRQLISSPLVLNGVAPRRWFFEGIVPITLMDLEENIIAEGYGTGDWLEPLAGSEELGAEDPIAFISTIEFTAPPAEVDMGKIRIAQDATGSEETGETPARVETMILWE